MAGLEDVQAMLEQMRVETLVYEERYQPPDERTLERMIEEAIAQSAEVLPLRHHPEELAQRGHIAAVLRSEALRTPDRLEHSVAGSTATGRPRDGLRGQRERAHARGR